MLVTFLFNITGSYLLFSALSRQHAALVYEKIEQDGFEAEELVDLTIAVNDPNLIFIEKHEIIYNDMLFDIVEITQTENNYIIKAYWDKKEENLDANFIAALKAENEPQKSSTNNISVKLILKDFRLHDDTSAPIGCAQLATLYANETNNYFSPSKKIIQPPPEA